MPPPRDPQRTELVGLRRLTRPQTPEELALSIADLEFMASVEPALGEDALARLGADPSRFAPFNQTLTEMVPAIEARLDPARALAQPQVGPPAQDQPPPTTIQQDVNAPQRRGISFGDEPVDERAFFAQTGQAPEDAGIRTQRDAEIFLGSGEGAPMATVDVAGVGEIDFPAVMTDQEIEAAIRDEFFFPPIGPVQPVQPARNILGQVARGAVGTAATGLEPLDFQARLQQGRLAAIDTRIRRAPDLDDQEFQTLLRDIARMNETAGVKGMMSRAARDLREGRIAEEDLPDFVGERSIEIFGEVKGALQETEQRIGERVDPEFAESLPGQVLQGVGSTTVFIGTRAIPVVGPALLPLTAGLIGSGEAIERSIAAGASDEETARAALMGVAPGLTDIVPIERLFRPFARVAGFKGGLYAIVRRMVEQGLVEGTQEGVQTAMQNLIQRYEITPEQEITDGIAEAGIVGFFVGTLFGGVAGAAAPARPRPVPTTPEAEALEARIPEPPEPSPVVPAEPTPTEAAAAELSEAVEPSQTREKITETAFRFEDDNTVIRTGAVHDRSHPDMVGTATRPSIAGFVTNRGRFLTKEEAAAFVGAPDNEPFLMAANVIGLGSPKPETRRPFQTTGEAAVQPAPPKPAKPQIPFTEKQLRGRNRNELERIARQLRLPKSVTHKKNKLLPKKQILENLMAAGTVQKPGRTLAFNRGPTPLLDMISRRGGIKDPGGELRAMDLDKFRKPFLKKPYQPESGLAQDLILEAAIEDGALPEGADLSDLFEAIRGEMFGKPAESPEEEEERFAETAALAVQEANRRHLEDVAEERGIAPDEFLGLDDDALAERLSDEIAAGPDETAFEDVEIIEDEVDRITREALAESEEDLSNAQADFNIEDDIPFGPAPPAVAPPAGVPEPPSPETRPEPPAVEEARARPEDAGERRQEGGEGVRAQPGPVTITYKDGTTAEANLIGYEEDGRPILELEDGPTIRPKPDLVRLAPRGGAAEQLEAEVAAFALPEGPSVQERLEAADERARQREAPVGFVFLTKAQQSALEVRLDVPRDVLAAEEDPDVRAGTLYLKDNFYLDRIALPTTQEMRDKIDTALTEMSNAEDASAQNETDKVMKRKAAAAAKALSNIIIPPVAKKPKPKVPEVPPLEGVTPLGIAPKAEPIARGPLREAEVPEDVARAFRETAQEQRGDPERIMLLIQNASPGVLSPVVERAGDLINRMMKDAEHGSFAQADVLDKIEIILRRLRHSFGFEREMAQNIENNANSRGETPEAHRANLDQLLARYAEAHAKLVVYNRPQSLANQIAIAVGRQQWQRAEDLAAELESIVQSDTYAVQAAAFERDPSGKLTPFGAEPTTEQTEIGEQFVVPGAEQREAPLPIGARAEISVERAKTFADPNVPLAKLRSEERAFLDKLKQDIKKRGIQQPLVIVGNTIFDGMHRLAVAEELGLEQVPVVRFDKHADAEAFIQRGRRDQPEPPAGGLFDEGARAQTDLVDLSRDAKNKEEAALRKAEADLAEKTDNPEGATKGPEALKDDAPEAQENVRKESQTRTKKAKKSAWEPGRGAKLRIETAKGKELLAGWRVVEVREETKEAVIQSLETGRRRTAPLGDLVRDKAHDGADPTKPVKRPKKARKAPKGVQPLREQPPAPPQEDAAFEPTPAPRLGELINRLRRVLGLVHRQGRLSTPGAIAEFKRNPGVVRTRVMEEIGAFAHEAGHRVDQVYSSVLFPAMSAHAEEIEGLANDRVPEGEERSEGFAEFFRLYIMSPTYAQRAAPGFFTSFETEMQKVAPDVLAEFKQIQQGYQQWRAQPADEAILADMASFKDQKGFKALRTELKEDGWVAFMTNRANRAYTDYVDRTNPIRQAVNYLLKVHRKNTGRVLELKAADNAYVLARLATDSYSRGHMDILYGVTPHNGTEPEGPGLADAFAEAFGGKAFDLWTEAKYEAFGSYLLSRRAIHEWDRYNEGLLPNEPTKQTKKQHQENVAKLQRENNAFSEAADQVYQFVNQLWRKKRDAGLITEEQYQAGLEKIDYVPLIRDVSDKTTVDGTNATTGAGAAFKRFRGSRRRVINPLEAIMRDAYMTAGVIAQNDVRGALVKIADIAGPGSGAIIEEVPAKEIKATFLDVREIATALKKDSDWEALDDRDAATLEAAIGIIDEMDIPMVRVFRAANAPERQEPIIYHWNQGERRMYRLADKAFGREVYNSITGLDRESRQAWINIMAYPAGWLRLGVTTEPSFFFANLIRDQAAAWILTDVGFKPGWSWVKGGYRELQRKDIARLYNVFGGIMGGANVAALNKGRIQQDFRAARKAGLNIRRFTSVRGLVELSEFSETATRLGIFELAMKQAKKRGLTDKEAAIEAVFIARDFIDFGRHGAKMLMARRVFTFLNAGMQGLDKGARVGGGQGNVRRAVEVYLKSQHGVPLTATEKRELKGSAKAWAQVVTIGVLGLGLTMLYRDDPEYNTFSEYLRATHWLAKIGGEWVAVPKPFELAFLSNIFERSFDLAYRDDPLAMERMRRGLWLMLAPPINAPALSVPIGALTNFDFFRERPLIPEYLKAREPFLRYNSYTSDFSKWVGRQMGISPILIDYWITGWAGSWGRSFLTATSATTADDPALGLDDMWVIRRFVRDPNRGNIATKEFWDAMNDRGGEMFSAFASYDALNTADENEGREYLRKLPEHRQVYAIFRRIAVGRGRGERKFHPMERATDALRATYNVRDTLREAPASDFSASLKQKGDDLLADLGTIEAHNAMVATEIPGWAEREPRDRNSKIQEIRELSPKLADLVEESYREKRVPDAQSVIDGYPDLKQTVLREIDRILQESP